MKSGSIAKIFIPQIFKLCGSRNIWQGKILTKKSKFSPVKNMHIIMVKSFHYTCALYTLSIKTMNQFATHRWQYWIEGNLLTVSRDVLIQEL